MKKLFKMGIVLTFMLFVLTGCTNTEYNIEMKNDGTGKVEYSVEYDEAVLTEVIKGKNEFSDMSIEKFYEFSDMSDLFFTLIDNAESNGYTTERIKKNESTVGYMATKEFDNMSEFKIEDSMTEGYVKITDDAGIKIEKGFFITKYTQSVTIDMKKGGESINNVKVTYDFPIGISKSNSDEKSLFTNKLTWNLENSENQQIEYTVYSFNISLIIAIIVVILVFVLIIVLIINKKKNKKVQK